MDSLFNGHCSKQTMCKSELSSDGQTWTEVWGVECDKALTGTLQKVKTKEQG